MAHLAFPQRKFSAGNGKSDPKPDSASEPLHEEPSSPTVLTCLQPPPNVKLQRRKMMSERPHRMISSTVARRLKFDEADMQWAEMQQAQWAVDIWPGAVNWSASA
eukprot:GGOE01009085.1.p6 GENE.GGOE01009085.1~~GGOE01009085.1.p6  ORF type:complete len:116 (+),score=26.05 GGOE01009085.1:36-350(+)